jgi:group II intron reverse transcriptase/maturase
MRGERRDDVDQSSSAANPPAGMSGRTSTKPYVIAKRAVWEAYQRVKANRGAAGVDEETIAMFEQNLSRNLYKLWNRMSSGSYFPPPVKQVEIPKAKGGTRKLGIPTVTDRIAQTVVKQIIEPKLDRMFHADSYGYRPGKSAKQSIAVTRKRCWQFDWVVEFDIKGAFDQIDHGLLMRAVRSHIKEDWILLYRAVANSAVRNDGRHSSATGTWYAARWSGQSNLDEPVHALCVRCLDEAHPSIVSVCPLRG